MAPWMARIPEPELMLGEEQALAYASGDFEIPHSRFVKLLRERLPELSASGTAVDFGCGPGDIAIRFARAFPDWRVEALDGSPAMLKLARSALERAGLASRIALREVRLPLDEAPRTPRDLVFSNSLLHHLADPAVLWSSARDFAGAAIFVMDLVRPKSPGRAQELVDTYAGGEPEVLRGDFYHSLLAAYRPREIREQLSAASLAHLEVELVSDRHAIVWGRIP